MPRIRTAWDDIQDVRRLFIAKDNDGLVLCRCDACAVLDNHKHQRTNFLNIRTCQDHTQSQGVSRRRGRPKRAALGAPRSIRAGHPPSFYNYLYNDIVAAKKLDVRVATAQWIRG